MTLSMEQAGDGKLQQAIENLVVANHILYDQKVVDGFGHVSVRHPQRSDCFLLARSMAPSLVRASDIFVYDLSGEPLDGAPHRPYAERFIHSAIYQARPDVAAVVHSHSTSVIPFSVSRVALRPVFHMCGFLAQVKHYDIREASGCMTDMLIRNAELGRSLAETLGDGNVALMRGHGSVAVGQSLKEAVYRAVYTEVNARVQTDAIGLGGTVTYLADEEARLADAANAGQYDRPWELWKLAAEANRMRG